MNLDFIAEVMENALSEGRRNFLWNEGGRILRGLGFNLPREQYIPAEEATIATPAFDTPKYIVGVISAEVYHKKVNGGLESFTRPEELQAVLARMSEAVPRHVPGAKIRGYLLRECFNPANSLSELMVSMANDPAFGPVGIVGLSGIDQIPGLFKKEVAIITPDELSRLEQRLERCSAGMALSAGFPLAPIKDLLESLFEVGEHFSFSNKGYTISGIEINPLFWAETGEVMPVDFKGFFSVGRVPPARPKLDMKRYWRTITNPAGIAVIGANDDTTRPGGSNVSNLKSHAMRVFPVTHKSEITQIQGMPAVHRLGEVPRGNNLAVLVVPAAHTAEWLAEVIKEKGRFGAAVLVNAGFAEKAGNEDLQAQLDSLIGQNWGLGIGGPNCWGLLMAHSVRYHVFTARSDKLPLNSGPLIRIIDISNSGQHDAEVMMRLNAMGLPLALLSIGNETFMSLGDYLQMVYENAMSNVSAVFSYNESIRPGDGKRVMGYISKLRQKGIPVVMHLGGTTVASNLAAMRHTAAVVTDTRIRGEMLERAGAYLVQGTDAFFDLQKMVASMDILGLSVRGDQIGISSSAGKQCTLGTQALEQYGFEVATLSALVEGEIRNVLGEMGVERILNLSHPVDMGPGASDESVLRVNGILLTQMGGLIAAGTYTPPNISVDVNQFPLREIGLARIHKRPYAKVIEPSPLTSELTTFYENHGIPVFPSIERAVYAMGLTLKMFSK